MMRQRKRFVGFLALAGLGLAACAQDVGLIDRTQPGLLRKSVFEGEWFMRRTVIDAPYDTGFTFIGEQDDVSRVRFEVQEHHLIAWRVLPQVENTQDAAPVAVFAIEDHVDVKREYNPSTGEQTNVKVENTEDRAWYDRDYLRVDWSKNLVTNFNFYVEQLDQDPVSYFVEDAADPDRLLLGQKREDGSWEDVQDGAALGLPTSQASAQFSNGEKEARLEITDMGGMGQMAILAMGMAQGEKEDREHAEKTWQEDGRTLHQSYRKDGSQAEFKMVLKNGIRVSIEGNNMDIKAVRGLLSEVNLSALEALQRKGKS